MGRQRHKFRPELEALEDRMCPSSTVVLPISAFLSQQGHDSVFTPPVPDENGWGNSIFDPGSTPTDPARFLWADYTGQAAQYLLQHGINLHTTVSGFVTETPIGNTGLMEVSVNLEATNALTWVAGLLNVTNFNLPNYADMAPLELGCRPQDLVAGAPDQSNPAPSSLTPALSNVHLQITWQEDIGAALPDIPRLNENYALYAPAGFAYERWDFQSWGVGTLDAGTTAGKPGQTAIMSASQVADYTNLSLPGTVDPGDSFWQEPVDIVPVSSPSAHVGYLNGSLFVIDTTNANDNVVVAPAANGAATLISNLGSGTFPAVDRVFVGLGSGNDNIAIGNLSAATVDVTTMNGNSNIRIGNAGKLVVSVGGGSNNIVTGNTSPAAEFIFVGGNGNNNVITADTANPSEIIVAGNGNNNISAAGSGDFIELLGNGNNNIFDGGTDDLAWLGGDGNNNVNNQGLDSFTEILAGTGHNNIDGAWGFAGAGSGQRKSGGTGG